MAEPMSRRAALVAAADRDVCLALLANHGAVIDAGSFALIAERFPADGEVRTAMFARSDLPVEVHQMLVKSVADLLGGMVVERAWISEARAAQVTREACERATVAIATSPPRNGTERSNLRVMRRCPY